MVFLRYFKVWSAPSDMAGQFPWESCDDFLRYWYWADDNSTLKFYRTVSKFSLKFFLFKMNRPLLFTYGNIIGIGLKPCMDTATLRTTLRRSGLSGQLIGTKSCQSYVCMKLKEVKLIKSEGETCRPPVKSITIKHKTCLLSSRAHPEKLST